MSIHEQWLLSAEEDYDSAVILFNAQKYKTAIYHSQQCAEKAFKGFLIFKKHPLVKIHDLVELLRLCKIYDQDFDKILHLALSLDGLDIEYRYPINDGSGIYDDPKDIQVQESIGNSKEIFEFVKSKCV